MSLRLNDASNSSLIASLVPAQVSITRALYCRGVVAPRSTSRAPSRKRAVAASTRSRFRSGIIRSSMPSEIPAVVAWANPRCFRRSTRATVSATPRDSKDQVTNCFSRPLV